MINRKKKNVNTCFDNRYRITKSDPDSMHENDTSIFSSGVHEHDLHDNLFSDDACD